MVERILSRSSSEISKRTPPNEIKPLPNLFPHIDIVVLITLVLSAPEDGLPGQVCDVAGERGQIPEMHGDAFKLQSNRPDQF